MSNPKDGTGQGGDRCVEAVCAMIAATYGIAPDDKKDMTPQDIMYALTKAWNKGRTVSALEPTSRVDELVKAAKDIETNHFPGLFANVQQTIDRGHISAAVVSDYRQLRLLGGGNPYHWNPATAQKAGHMVLVVGYGDGVVVHDPLRSEETGQPAEYSVTSFEEAGWETLVEIAGPRLDTPPPPTEKVHRIQPGETFWSIAEREYGNPHFYSILEQANPEMPPHQLQIGAEMIIPPPPEPGSGATMQHRIVAGDTFWKIATQVYGDGTKYPVIEAANPDVDPNTLQIGSFITVPIEA